MSKLKIVTSEYVSYGHPDKVADQISDAILDAYLKGDSHTRAGIETMIKDNVVVVGGEVTSNAVVSCDNVIRDIIDGVGYPESHHLGSNNIKIINLIGEQSSEISQGVDREDCDCIGAGDQGFVVGMASNETKEYLPLGVYLAREICNAVCLMEDFGPDVKTQVCVGYGGRIPVVTDIIISAMHSEKYSDVESVREAIKKVIESNEINSMYKVMDKNIYLAYIKNKNINYHINANGTWYIGGPISDCGMTGRKIVVDQYGGYCNVGGGCFSGKDMSKVDRSGAYMARYLAKNIVHAGLADTAKVELSYIISQPEPCTIKVELTNPKETALSDLASNIETYILNYVALSPSGIMERFCLRSFPSFYHTARRGHFGYNDDTDNYPWEALDLSDSLNEYLEEKELQLLEN